MQYCIASGFIQYYNRDHFPIFYRKCNISIRPGNTIFDTPNRIEHTAMGNQNNIAVMVQDLVFELLPSDADPLIKNCRTLPTRIILIPLKLIPV